MAVRTMIIQKIHLIIFMRQWQLRQLLLQSYTLFHITSISNPNVLLQLYTHHVLHQLLFKVRVFFCILVVLTASFAYTSLSRFTEIIYYVN